MLDRQDMFLLAPAPPALPSNREIALPLDEKLDTNADAHVTWTMV
jgi:hypothetical protein